jgi:hypothetical protein
VVFFQGLIDDTEQYGKALFDEASPYAVIWHEDKSLRINKPMFREPRKLGWMRRSVLGCLARARGRCPLEKQKGKQKKKTAYQAERSDDNSPATRPD